MLTKINAGNDAIMWMSEDILSSYYLEVAINTETDKVDPEPDEIAQLAKLTNEWLTAQKDGSATFNEINAFMFDNRRV